MSWVLGELQRIGKFQRPKKTPSRAKMAAPSPLLLLGLDRTLVGLDIGTRSIKAVVLGKQKKRLYVKSAFCHDLCKSNPAYPDNVDLQSQLTALLEANGLSRRRAAGNLNDRIVNSYELTLPPIPAAEMKMAILNQLADQLTIGLDDAQVDFVELGSPGETENRLRAFVASKGEIQKTFELMKTSGLTPTAIEPDLLASIAALAYNDYLEVDSAQLVVDLGESKITLAIVSAGQILYSSVLNQGLGSLYFELKSQLNIPYKEADELVRQYDLVVQDGKPTDWQIALDEVWYVIFQKVQKLLGFIQAGLKDKEISKIILIGGGTRLLHINEAFKDICNVPTVCANPFLNIDLCRKGKEPDPEMAAWAGQMTTAVGLALRGFDED